MQWMLQNLSLAQAWSCTPPPPSAQPAPVRSVLVVSSWNLKGSMGLWETDTHQKPSQMPTLCYILHALKEGEKKPEGLNEQIELNSLFYQKHTQKTVLSARSRTVSRFSASPTTVS